MIESKQIYKLNIGPGKHWRKPSPEWISIDINPKFGDIVLDLNNFKKFPLEDETVKCIYGSHVFEHVYNSLKVFFECYRVLMPGGYFRLIIPDICKSMREYLNQNIDFPLFQRRIQRAKKRDEKNYTIFQALKEDFISYNKKGLTHQNAWDFETIKFELNRAGFSLNKIKLMDFKVTDCKDFLFEGLFPSEANHNYRSLYIEVRK